MKKHNTLKIVLITLVTVLLLTWLLPTTANEYGQITAGERSELGILNLFAYSTLTFNYFKSIIMFVLSIGAFYGVLHKVGAYRNLLDYFVKNLKGKENIFLSVIIAVIAVITSVSGVNYVMLFLFPFLISLILMLGYDKITATLVTVGSVLVGMMGTTLGIGNIMYFEEVLTVGLYSEIWTKLIILVLGIVVLIYNVNIINSKKKKSKLEEDDEVLLPAKSKDKKSFIPLAIVFDLTLLVMILALVPWEATFNINFFANITNWVTSFEIFGYPIFAKVLGQFGAFGTWTMDQMAILVMISTGIIGLIYVRSDDFFDGIIDGLKKSLYPTLIAVSIYTILIIVVYHPFQLTIVKFILDLTKGFNIATIGLVTIIGSVLNVEASYVVQGITPYITSVITNKELYPLIAVMTQSLHALTMFVAPTSIVLMLTLNYLNVNYLDWLKNVWKIVLQILAILFVIFVIVLLI